VDNRYVPVRTPRVRRYIHPALISLVRPIFRYSETREAYVLRLVGNRWGPVLRPSGDRQSVARA
jgi:hypothetical protein